MEISKIKSFYSLNELFSFISDKRKFKIIKYNIYLNKKLDLSIDDYKEFFFQKKINKYDYVFINDYYIEFKNDLNDIIDDNSYNLFLNALSKKKDFILNIKDKDFKLMIENKYFKENPRFEIEEINIPRLLLIKDNKLTNKAINTFKNIFNLFSINGTMNEEQSISYFQTCGYYEWESNDLFIYDKDKDGFILFEDFIKYCCDLINKDLNEVWHDLANLGYNNYLNYNLDELINNKDEFEESIIFNNFIQLTNLKINKLSLCFKIDKILIDYLNKKDILINVKEINISLFNVKQFIELNIICPNTEELNLYIYEEDPEINKYEINNIFSNIITLKLYIFKSFDLIDFMDNN